MYSQITTLNVFLVPLISLLIFYRRSGKEMRMSLVFLCEYAVSAVANMIVSKCVLKIIGVIAVHEIQVHSSYYTLVAAVVAFLLPYAYEVYKKNVKLHLKVQNDDANEE